MGKPAQPHGKISRCAKLRSTKCGPEKGEDFITVRLHINLLDSTVDGRTGAVVNGSNLDPIDFEESWTFDRPVSPCS